MKVMKSYTTQVLLCKNVSDMKVQAKAFLVESEENWAEECNHLMTSLDFSAWKE